MWTGRHSLSFPSCVSASVEASFCSSVSVAPFVVRVSCSLSLCLSLCLSLSVSLCLSLSISLSVSLSLPLSLCLCVCLLLPHVVSVCLSLYVVSLSPSVSLCCSYVHSVGRTARMGKEGTAATLYDRDSPERLAVKKLLAALGARDKQQQQQKVLRRRIDSQHLEVIRKEVKETPTEGTEEMLHYYSVSLSPCGILPSTARFDPAAVAVAAAAATAAAAAAAARYLVCVVFSYGVWRGPCRRRDSRRSSNEKCVWRSSTSLRQRTYNNTLVRKRQRRQTDSYQRETDRDSRDRDR